MSANTSAPTPTWRAGHAVGVPAGAVTVRPPATSANLGPGFDALGLALELRDEVTVAATEEPGLTVTVRGEGAGEVPCDENHLIVRSLLFAFDAMGARPTGLRISCLNRIPHGRGLGSSSAAICAGLVAARELTPHGRAALDDDALLDLADQLEGHPDNVAPALRGGLTVAWSADTTDTRALPAAHDVDRPHGANRVGALRLTPDSCISAMVFIPPTVLATERARRLLPDQVPYRDAAFNVSRTGLLTAALTAHGLSESHRAMLLHAGTEDRLHQAYRAPAMPESAALISRMRAHGLAAAVSGAGPTVLVLTVGAEWARRAVEHAPPGWRTEPLRVAIEGVLAEPAQNDTP